MYEVTVSLKKRNDYEDDSCVELVLPIYNDDLSQYDDYEVIDWEVTGVSWNLSNSDFKSVSDFNKALCLFWQGFNADLQVCLKAMLDEGENFADSVNALYNGEVSYFVYYGCDNYATLAENYINDVYSDIPEEIKPYIDYEYFYDNNLMYDYNGFIDDDNKIGVLWAW